MRLKLKCWFLRNFSSNTMWCNPEKPEFGRLKLWDIWWIMSNGTVWRKIGHETVYIIRKKF